MQNWWSFVQRNNMKLKIALFTSIRSDYGLQVPIMNAIKQDTDLELVLLVGGAHFDKELGYSYDLIKKDGFSISEEFKFLSSDKSKYGLANSSATLLNQLVEYFKANPVDFVLLYGDRYELLPLATCCLLLDIPMGHVSGGEITDGVIDNQVRHAVAKMAHLHFPALKEYGENLMRMGEEPWRVFVVGEPGLDFLKDLQYISKDKLYSDLGLDEKLKTILITFHPETISNEVTVEFVEKTILELNKLKDYQILATAANADNYGDQINHQLKSLQNGIERFVFIPNLGQVRYYSLLKYVHCVLGNSSSGIVEVQSFLKPVVNVGKRQSGRIKNPNVIDCISDSKAVIKAFLYSQSDEFAREFQNKENIFGNSDSSKTIVKKIKENLSNPEILRKRTVWK